MLSCGSSIVYTVLYSCSEECDNIIKFVDVLLQCFVLQGVCDFAHLFVNLACVCSK